MDKIVNFLFSKDSSYNYQKKDGGNQSVSGVDKGFANVYCLENDTTNQMMGNLQDATIMSQEACESAMGDAEAGRLPAFEQWGLDAPEAAGGQLDDARDVSDMVGGSPELDSMKAAAAN